VAKLTFVQFAWLLILLAASNVVGKGILQAQESEEGPSFSYPRIESAKITLGVVEDIILNPWGISIPARIDTGADLSSLDARDIVVRNNVAAFKLGKRFGGLQLELPVVEWARIQTSTGTERRPVVEISICLGSKHFRTLATLKDRAAMIYPFLVGRSALSSDFLVDPSRSRAAQPACSPASLASSQTPSSPITE
jgi:hypothetical protein